MAAVSKSEFLWREWLLGEVRYAGRGPKSTPRPNVGYGDPKRGQKPVPSAWWMRLEEFLVRRNDSGEVGRQHPLDPPATVTPRSPEQLTPHFNVREFDCHDGRKVPALAVPALKRLCTSILEPMRARFGPGHVLSGYRPVDYNRRIGGAPLSQHIYELGPDSVAADTMWATGTPADWAAYADHLGAGGVGRYDHSGFVHCDNRPGRARWTG